ncbi:flagellar biosynthesis protein FliH [Sphingomonas ginsenosidivorax]|uniref:Flagellar biosynthesis protein FliH n=1 Tax=Sphingomonas ginsenosidivorax TaxID=862135 RepID=A0A5C6UM93_9SPHN|nr:FliH/SctL family protein [Sphingomonas ginsenosidivorax]TXC72438.1 flagellar biosynthesis protein FliH [Sphingomonas ginsenosidivorax]
MSDFVAGMAARHDAAALAMRAAFPIGATFAPADLRQRAATRGPVAFRPQSAGLQSGGPKHFRPADPDVNPTAGWDPMDAGAEPSAYIDPIAAAHADGYAEGFAAATAAAQADAVRNQAFGTALAAALGSGERIDRERVAEQLRQTVMHLVGKLVGEIGISPELLATRIEAASDLLADKSESALLRVHPDDVPLLEGHLPKTIFPVGDAGLARGSFVLESASTIVEDGPESWLEQLTSAIERVSVPPLC